MLHLVRYVALRYTSVFIFEEYLTHLAVSLNWTAVSFMLAFPLQNAIKEAPRRLADSYRVGVFACRCGGRMLMLCFICIAWLTDWIL